MHDTHRSRILVCIYDTEMDIGGLTYLPKTPVWSIRPVFAAKSSPSGLKSHVWLNVFDVYDMAVVFAGRCESMRGNYKSVERGEGSWE